MKMRITYKPTQDLAPYALNARTHSDFQVRQIAKSIQEFGFNNPVLVDSDDTIIAGHGRVLAALELELTEVPTVVLKHMNDAQRRAYILADNQLALNAGWDKELLALEMQELHNAGFDTTLIGFGEKELEEIFGVQEKDGLTDPDEIPDLDPGQEPTTQKGDLWILGNHRLMCGDSTEAQAVKALMDGDQADMGWTDPPYNVDYEGGTGLKIINDNMNDGDFYAFLYHAFSSYNMALKPGGCLYVAHADTEGANFRRAFVDAGLDLKQCLVWVKNSAPLSRQDYNWKHEPILYGWKPGAAHYFCRDFTKTTVIDDDANIDKMKTARLREYARELEAAIKSTIVRVDRPTKNMEHPTMKPVRLIVELVENSSQAGEIVLDLFGGSGSTLIACEKMTRKARLMELDPRYCDVIIKRWQDFTGEFAILEGTSQTFAEVKNGRT